jgi:hypothetical protein
VALAGWVFLFHTTGRQPKLYGVGVVALGILSFLVWSRATRRWPFATLPHPETTSA